METRLKGKIIMIAVVAIAIFSLNFIGGCFSSSVPEVPIGFALPSNGATSGWRRSADPITGAYNFSWFIRDQFPGLNEEFFTQKFEHNGITYTIRQDFTTEAGGFRDTTATVYKTQGGTNLKIAVLDRNIQTHPECQFFLGAFTDIRTVFLMDEFLYYQSVRSFFYMKNPGSEFSPEAHFRHFRFFRLNLSTNINEELELNHFFERLKIIVENYGGYGGLVALNPDFRIRTS